MNAFFDLWCRWATRPGVVIASLLAGIAVGLFAPGVAASIGFFGDIYVDLLKMIVLPFMVSAVIFSLRQLMQEGSGSQLIGRAVPVILLSMLATAVIGLAAGLTLRPGADLPADTLQTLGRLVGEDLDRSGHIEMALSGDSGESAASGASKAPGIAAILFGIVPGNIFAALAQGDTLKVLVFSLLFGLALGKAPAGIAQSLTQTLEMVYRACQTLTRWFNYMLPPVLMAMVASQVAKTGIEPMRAMLHFIATLGAASLLLIVLCLWMLRLASGQPWRDVLRSQREPLTMAVATRNSLACMPAMIESLAVGLRFPRTRIELMVPFGVSLLRLGPILYYIVATLFIAQMYGQDLAPAQIALVAVGAMLAGFASAGMNGLVTISLTGVVCGHIGLPFEAVFVLFVAIDPICDMFRTTVLVAGNNALAALACGREQASR